MDYTSIEQKKQNDAMEVPEIDGGLLIELLDASLAATDDDAGENKLGFVADGDCWIDSQELSYDIHTRQDCEDCGLEGILSDLEEHGSPRPRSPEPYVVFDDDVVNTLEWAETADAAMGAPFTGGCMGDWYMDGMFMAMEWGDEDGGAGFVSFEPCYGGGEAGAEQVYGSPLWG